MNCEEDIKNIKAFLDREVYEYDSESSLSTEVNEDCELLKETSSLWKYAQCKSGELCMSRDEQEVLDKCFDVDLRLVLTKNIRLRHTLESIVDALQSQLDQFNSDAEKVYARKLKSGKRSAVKARLGIPYFKDENQFPCPINADHREILDSKKMIILNFHHTYWTEEDKYYLAKSVYQEICLERSKELQKEIDGLRTRRTKNKNVSKELSSLESSKRLLQDAGLLESVAKSWKTNSADEHEVKKKKDELSKQKMQLRAELVASKVCDFSGNAYKTYLNMQKKYDNFENELIVVQLAASWTKDVDWLKIATTRAHARHSDIECKAMWNCFLNPIYSKLPWKESEKKMLKFVATKYKFQDWESIAKELNIRRSGYMCCLQYQTTLSERLRRNKWSAEEDRRLLSVLDSCRIGSKISWSKVRCSFPDRTREQIYNRYRYCLHPDLKKGRFSVEEDVLLLTLIKLFENNHAKLKPFFPQRHICQIRDRILTLRTDVPRPWSIEEDVEIIKHVEEHGTRRWNRMKLDRNFDTIRHRYNFLLRWFEANPMGTLEEVERRQCKVKLEKFQKRSEIVETLVTKLLQDVQKHDDRTQILNLDYIRKWLPNVNRTVEKARFLSRRATTRDENVLDRMLYDFFKNTFKLRGRKKVAFTPEQLQEASMRVEAILKNLDATVEFPTMEEVRAHPCLDEFDHAVIERMVRGRREKQQAESVCLPGRSGDAGGAAAKLVPYKTAPNPDTLIGFRGLMLQLPTVVEHARGYMKCPGLFDAVGNVPNVREYGLKHAFKATELELLELDDDLRAIVLRERHAFAQRLRSLLWWPCLMSNSTNLPVDYRSIFNEKPEAPAPRKRGRPRKNNSKVEMMRAAKKAKQDARVKSEPESTDDEDILNLSD